jgi:hypothetical protein
MNTDIKPTQSAVHGASPVIWYGKSAPDATSANWARACIGSVYIYKVSANRQERWLKVKDDKVAGDWQLEYGWLSWRVRRSDAWTDGGAASGTIVLPGTIPLGAIVTHAKYTNVTGFTGNTSATLTIGDGTDADRYMTGTPSVFATIDAVSVGNPSGTAYHAAAISTITATMAGNTDFTAISAGEVTVSIFYR